MRIREWPKEEEKKKEKGLFAGMEEGGKPFRARVLWGIGSDCSFKTRCVE